jgi:hypothetical protein
MDIRKLIGRLRARLCGRIIRRRILKDVTNTYLSDSFNGTPAIILEQKLGIDWNVLRPHLKHLIENDVIGVLFSSDDVNTHILRLGFSSKESQVARLPTNDLLHTCVYPRPKHLTSIVDISDYADRPFELCLALGEPQLAYRSFDLSVLEVYRNDPRYAYSNDDVSGHISVTSEHYEGDTMPEPDKILLQSFGFSYDVALNRAVAVFLRYLQDLSPEHQQIWKARELTANYKLHPDYYRASVMGDWPERLPIFQALVMEMHVINKMAAAMGRPVLFRRDFGVYGEGRPRKLSFLVRPTLEEFNDFVLLLDKTLSDNINKDFFQNDVSYETELKRPDGKLQVQQKGTLQILDDWVRKNFRPADWKLWDESIKALRDVRTARQKPAHAIDENVFDQKYIKDQRDLIIRVYSAIRTVRLILANHPKVQAAEIEIPEWVRNGEIWGY